jgi:hypothetical protein
VRRADTKDPHPIACRLGGKERFTVPHYNSLLSRHRSERTSNPAYPFSGQAKNPGVLKRRGFSLRARATGQPGLRAPTKAPSNSRVFCPEIVLHSPAF